MAVGAAGTLCLAGCKLGEYSNLRSLQDNVKHILLNNDDIISKVNTKNLSYLLTKYQIKDAEDGLLVDIYGKLSDSEYYKSFIKLTYSGIEKNYIDEKKADADSRIIMTF